MKSKHPVYSYAITSLELLEETGGSLGPFDDIDESISVTLQTGLARMHLGYFRTVEEAEKVIERFDGEDCCLIYEEHECWAAVVTVDGGVLSLCWYATLAEAVENGSGLVKTLIEHDLKEQNNHEGETE